MTELELLSGIYDNLQTINLFLQFAVILGFSCLLLYFVFYPLIAFFRNL